jgi:hypothetical protein
LEQRAYGGVALSLEGMKFADDTDLLRSLNEAFRHTDRDELVGGAVNDQERRRAGFHVTAPPCFPEFIIDLPDLLDKRGGKKLAK